MNITIIIIVIIVIAITLILIRITRHIMIQKASNQLQAAITPSALQEAFQTISQLKDSQLSNPSALGCVFSATLLSLLTTSQCNNNDLDNYRNTSDPSIDNKNKNIGGNNDSNYINENDNMDDNGMHAMQQVQSREQLFPSFLPQALAALLPFLDTSPVESVADEDSRPMAAASINLANNVRIGKKKVHFCEFDGSSVKTPGKECSSDITLQTARRLHSLIENIDNLIAGILYNDNNSDAINSKISLLDSMLCYCQLLTESTSALMVSRAAYECLSLSVIPGDIVAIANILTSELSAAKAQRATAAITPLSLVGVRTVLRHRTAWMTTSVLRAQLRWLFDAPPASLSVPSVSGHPKSRYRRSDIHRVVTLREPPAPITKGKKQRRKSHVVLMDHTLILPSEMSLSSLLTHSLRQIYDAFISAVASTSSHTELGPSLDTLVTQFLTTTVTGACDQEERPLLEELEITQPQVHFMNMYKL